MINRLRRLNPVLPDMIAIEIVFAVIIELVGIFFVKSKLQYSIGVILGMGLAIFMLVHMSIVILDAVEAVDKRGRRRVTFKALFRYLIIVLVVAACVYTKWGDPIACIVTIMGVKLAGYLQPVLHKRFSSKKEGGE